MCLGAVSFYYGPQRREGIPLTQITREMKYTKASLARENQGRRMTLRNACKIQLANCNGERSKQCIKTKRCFCLHFYSAVQFFARVSHVHAKRTNTKWQISTAWVFLLRRGLFQSTNSRRRDDEGLIYILRTEMHIGVLILMTCRTRSFVSRGRCSPIWRFPSRFRFPLYSRTMAS